MGRLIIRGFSLLVFIFLGIINWICLALDNLFFWRFRKVEVKPPVYVIGMPRSATTLCYTLLTADSDNFTSMRLWEILLAPSIIQRKILLALKKIDVAINHPLFKAVSRFEKFLFQKVEDIHLISLFNFEEDDFLFWHVFSTPSFIFLFPKNKRIISLQNFDLNLSTGYKRFLMKFYRNCIKRHLYVFGDTKRYLAKCPSHTPRIMTLPDYFPGCQFIYMLRNPSDTIASTLNLFSRFKMIFHPKMNMDSIITGTLSLADLYYKYPLVICRELIGKSIFILPFKELTSNTIVAIKLIYLHLGLSLPDRFRKFLQVSDDLKGKHKAKRKHSLEEFGLTNSTINERYNYVFQEYSDCI